MATAPADELLLEIAPDPTAPIPLQRQLYEALRAAIAEGRLRPGLRLPSTRRAAQELGLARNTILGAFQQLIDEGYLAARRGSGTYVAADLDAGTRQRDRPARPARLSRFGTSAARRAAALVESDEDPLPLQPGVPALDRFPMKAWRRLSAACLRELGRSSREALAYGGAAGHPPLRDAIAEHLRVTRGLRCEGAQVVITAGTQGAIDLVARTLLEDDDAVWFEEPGYAHAREALRAAGRRVAPVPVDAHGLQVEIGRQRAPEARLAYVTPSHQYPTGVTMSLPRRLELLRWSGQRDAWVVEDDYDSEFRHVGRPIAALHGQDDHGRVIYAGTFSKTLFPALRLGYLILPPQLVTPFTAARSLVDRGPPLLDQLVLTRFLEEGHFARHVKRMRDLYRARRRALEEALAAHAPDLLDLIPSETGLQLAGWLPHGVNDAAFARALAHHGLGPRPMSYYALEPLPRGGLNLGFGGTSEEGLSFAAARMQAVYAEGRWAG